MKTLLCIALVLTSRLACGQSISSTNMNYLYDPDFRNEVVMKVVNDSDSVRVYYEIAPTLNIVGWEKRLAYSEREGEAISAPSRQKGVLAFPRPLKTWYLVLKVTGSGDNIRLYFKPIDAAYPVNGLVRTADQRLSPKFIHPQTVTIQSPLPYATVFYYKTDFPAASAPFAGRDQSGKAVFKHDSVYTINTNEPVSFRSRGLYLVQPDSSTSFGFAFRVESPPYPKINRVIELAPPLIYLCTQEEFGALLAAGDQKARFDKTILDITGDRERAKDLMKFYYRRIEWANTLFTSFKEGWKTDRGMILTIFGIPDEVFFNGINELWSYNDLKMKFNFFRAGSIYDPDNYVLNREKRFAEIWYYTIDLWRKDQLHNQKF